MAGNMDPNELQAVSDALEELRKSGNLSAESLAKLNGNSVTVSKALEGYTRSLLGGASAVGSMAKSVAQGEGSFASLTGAVSGLTSVVGKLAGAIPIIGGAAKALAEGVGEAAKYVLEQMDVMARNYQTLGDASATAADGIDGLYRQFYTMGNYSLPAFTRAVKANTTGLAALSGTAADGADRLSELAGDLTTGKLGERFLKMGISLDAVGDAAAAYASDSARYGLLQGTTQEELTKRTQNYIVEVDKIARLTGQTREAQQKEAQKSLANVQFRARLDEMRATGQGAQAEQLRLYVEGLGGAAGDAARALVTGIPLTKEAAAANLFANDAIRQNTQAIIAGKGATTAITETQQALADGTDRFGKQLQYTGDVFGGVAIQAYDYKAIIAEQNKLMSQGMTREQAIAAVQKRQAEAAGQSTEEFVSAQMAIANTSKNIQGLGFSLATAAIPAVNGFAKVIEKFTDFVYDKMGVPRPANRMPFDPGTGTGWDGEPRKPDVAPVVEDWRRRQLDNQLPSGDNRRRLLDLIGQGESRGNYNALVGGGTADLTNMTVAQVQEFQKTMLAKGRPSTAVGKYQMVAATLGEQMKKAGLDPTTTKFDQKTQDLLAQQLIDQAGYGKKDSATVMRNLSGTWASLPKDMSGRGTYDGHNTNQANINPRDLMAAIAGPTGKYQSSMAGVSPAAAGVETAASAQKTTDTQQQNQALDSIAQSAATLVELQRQSNGTQLKTQKYIQLR
jgi:muramidase (phage lysozyme)